MVYALVVSIHDDCLDSVCALTGNTTAFEITFAGVDVSNLGDNFSIFFKYREPTVKEGRKFCVVKILLANKQVLLLSEMDEYTVNSIFVSILYFHSKCDLTCKQW